MDGDTNYVGHRENENEPDNRPKFCTLYIPIFRSIPSARVGLTLPHGVRKAKAALAKFHVHIGYVSNCLHVCYCIRSLQRNLSA